MSDITWQPVGPDAIDVVAQDESGPRVIATLRRRISTDPQETNPYRSHTESEWKQAKDALIQGLRLTDAKEA